MWWLWTALAAPEAQVLAERLVHEIGPRPAGSEASAAAQAWVSERLRERGWSPERWGRGATAVTYACRAGNGPVADEKVLFFAHVDTVHSDCPGANDNAAAVGALLELATRVDGAERTVCLAFPDGEEVGLLGSRALLRSGRMRGVDQVVALDLVGRGTPTHNGLGAAFSSADARALLAAAPAEVPWVYRALSLGVPHMERSDHLPWAQQGIPASHLMARGESGVFWAYHTTADVPEVLQSDTLVAVVDHLEGIARLPPLAGDGRGEPWFVVPFTSVVVPGWGTWLLTLLGGGIGLAGLFVPNDPSTSEEESTPWLRVSIALVAGIAGLGIALAGRSMVGDLATPALVAAWASWAAALAAVPGGQGPWALRLAGVTSLCAGVALLALGQVLLALPVFAVSAGVGLTAAVRGRSGAMGALLALGALLASWPALYLVRPAAVRELAFHHLVPATFTSWAIGFAALALPVTAVLAAAAPRSSRRVAVALSGVALLGVLWAWVSPVRSGVYDVDPWLRPEVQRSAPLPGAPDAIP